MEIKDRRVAQSSRRQESAASLPDDSDRKLRRAAEKTALSKEVLIPEKLGAMLPDEAKLILHELLVHQIELEMQNEELQRTQAELAVARARYFDLYDLAPVGYLVVSEKGLIIETNLTAAAQLGVARGALIQQPISRFICKEDENCYYLHRKQLLETGVQQSCELRLLKKSGKTFWANLEIATVLDAIGLPVCHLVISDITARKQAEESLNQKVLTQKLLATISADLLNATMDNITDKINAIIRTIGEFFQVDRCYRYKTAPDRNGMILMNEWCREDIPSVGSRLPEIFFDQYPWWKEKIQGEMPVYLPHIDQAPPEAAAEKQAFAELKTRSILQLKMIINQQLYGFIGFDSVRQEKVWTEDQLELLNVIVNIISDALTKNEMEKALLAAKEKAEHDNKLKTEYFANFSHEFRTPLNVILSAIQLFELYMGKEETRVSEKTAKHVKSMKQNTLRLIRLVNNLIDVTRIDSGYYQPEMHNYDLLAILGKIVAAVSAYGQEKGIQLVFAADCAEKMIQCDAAMIEQIMLNLISNAIKFSGSECRIKITVSQTPGEVIISVLDNGRGIVQDQQGIIFERYKQAAESLYQKSEGSGIGLALAKALVEMQGGTIGLKSQPDCGSEFIIKLPDRLLNNEGAAPDAGAAEDEQALIARMNIEFSDIYR